MLLCQLSTIPVAEVLCHETVVLYPAFFFSFSHSRLKVNRLTCCSHTCVMALWTWLSFLLGLSSSSSESNSFSRATLSCFCLCFLCCCNNWNHALCSRNHPLATSHYWHRTHTATESTSIRAELLSWGRAELLSWGRAGQGRAAFVGLGRAAFLGQDRATFLGKGRAAFLGTGPGSQLRCRAIMMATRIYINGQ